jgi:hypothetical protein
MGVNIIHPIHRQLQTRIAKLRPQNANTKPQPQNQGGFQVKNDHA